MGAGYGNIDSDMEDYYSDSDSEDYNNADDNADDNGLFGNDNNPQGQEILDEDELYADQYYHITLRSRLPNIRRRGILPNCDGTINVACSGKIYVLKREDTTDNHNDLMNIYSHVQAQAININDVPVILLINKNRFRNNNVRFYQAESIEINGRYIEPLAEEYTTSDPIYDFDILDTNQFLNTQRELGLR